uniref:2'-5'-oligoadenylate synthetase 1 domain-containing protein n=1 Tax=Athene cunicularia TaxID=194338 RepID=A0A663MEJ5_ATHCN
MVMVSANELDRWIAKTLEPSPAFRSQVKQTVKQICDFLKEDCFETNIRVHKTVKGGSAGKGTALQNNSDADVVLFLSHFSSYKQQKQERNYILDLIKRRLHVCRETLTFTVTISKPQYRGPSNTPRSVSLTLGSRTSPETIKVDILPAYDALGQVGRDPRPDMEVYVGLLNAGGEPGEFSPCFTELQKKFVKRYPVKLKNLLRLVKHWYKELLKPRYCGADLPPKYALELLTIYAWEEGTGSCNSFVMAEGFRTVLELLCRHREICIYWEMYYSLQHVQIGAHIKNLMIPIILDPADPTGILGKDTRWDLMAQKAAEDLLLLPCVNTARPWDVEVREPVPVMEEQGLRQQGLHPSPCLQTPVPSLGTSPTSWCWAHSGCRRCHPRRSTGPGPGSTRHRPCHRRHSGAGAAGPVPRPSRHRAVAGEGEGMESGAEHPGTVAQGWAEAWQDTGTHPRSPLTRLEESCRLVMGEASCGQSAGKS